MERGNITYLIAVLVAVLSLSIPGTAQDSSSSDKPFYLYGAGSVPDLQVDTGSDDRVTFDDSDLSYKVYGGRRFSRYFGIELSLVDYGVPDGRVVDVSGLKDGQLMGDLGTTFHAVGYLPQGIKHPDSGDRLELSWKTGPALFNPNSNTLGQSGNGISRNKHLGASFGIGTKLNLSSRFALRAEGETIMGFKNESSNHILGFFGFEYHFK